MDNMQRARELLAAHYDADGRGDIAALIRGGVAGHIQTRKAEEVIAAALRTAPEGCVLVPVEIARRAEDALCRFTSDEGWCQADMDASDDFSALLAARPKGAKQC